MSTFLMLCGTIFSPAVLFAQGGITSNVGSAVSWLDQVIIVTMSVLAVFAVCRSTRRQ